MFWKATEESPRMFESDFLDAFTRIPWWVVPLIFAPIVTGLIYVAMAVQGVALAFVAVQFAAGFVVWTLAEYWLHRTLFHWTPDTWWGAKFHFILHGVHHDWFKDRYRLVMPPAVSLALAAVFFGSYWAIAQAAAPLADPSWVYAFMAGKIVGYVNYDVTHYYIHHGKPSLSFYKKLRHHHNNHHHANPERKFGVSFTVWDRVFGTYAVDRPARETSRQSA